MDSVADEPNFQVDQRRLQAGDDAGVWGEPALALSSAASSSREEHRAWLANEWNSVNERSQTRAFAALVLLSGFFAIATTLLKGALGFGLLAIVVGAPVIEEVAKSLGPVMVLEKRPWLFKSALSIVVVGFVSGLVFASVENLLYFFVYISEKELTRGIIVWRLAACTLLHVAGAAITCTGLARCWTRASKDRAAFILSPALPWLIAAMSLHGLYNLGAVVYGLFIQVD